MISDDVCLAGGIATFDHRSGPATIRAVLPASTTMTALGALAVAARDILTPFG